MSITKKDAAIIWAYGYDIVDNVGNKIMIELPRDDSFQTSPYGKLIKYSDFGIDFFILSYHNSCLTKQINGVIPISLFVKQDVIGTHVFNGMFIDKYREGMITIKQSETLYSLHFLPHGIEESNVRWIE